MGYEGFDKYASEYDAWFIENRSVLESEVKLVARCLSGQIGDVLSIGCGSGLFEKILSEEYNIKVSKGIEPAAGMAEIATKRGMEVEVVTVEAADLGCELYDTILFNGCPCYITDLKMAFDKAHRALRPGGKIIVIDVPKESSYGTLYNLAMAVGSWDHPLLQGVAPKLPYPIELVKQASWRTTAEKVELLKECNFGDLTYAQTLTRHPLYSDDAPEEPTEGYDRGDYVAIIATKQ
ncbi:MAG: class I SAM-dependent methyltransferase [Rikenellaceae bacterium]